MYSYSLEIACRIILGPSTFRHRLLFRRKLPRCNKDFIQCFINTIHFIHYLISHLIIFSTKDKTSFCRLKNDPGWPQFWPQYDGRLYYRLTIVVVIATDIAMNILQTFPINFIMSFELISSFNLIWLFLFIIKSNWFYTWSHFCLFSFKLKPCLFIPDSSTNWPRTVSRSPLSSETFLS